MKMIPKIFDLQRIFFMNNGYMPRCLEVDVNTYNKLLIEYNKNIRKFGGFEVTLELKYIIGLTIIKHLSRTKIFEVS